MITNHMTAYFDRLLNHSEEEKKSWLSLEGWSTDTPGKFDSLNPLDRPVEIPFNNTAAEIQIAIQAAFDRVTPNEGAKKRHALCSAGRKVKFVITPRLGILRCNRYLPPGVQLDVRIKWNSPQLVMMTGDTHVTAPKFKIVPFSPKLHVRHIEANSELHLYNETEMLTKQRIAVYPHPGNRFVTQTINDGRRKGSFHNVFQGSRPNCMFVAFQEGTAVNGAYNKNPFNFKDMHQSTVRVTVDGDEIPFQRLELDSHHREEGYLTLINFSGKVYDSAAIGINREGYKEGNYILAYNFNPDGSQNDDYNFNRNIGNVNIDVDFSQVTADNTTIVVYGEFEQELWVDGHKNVSLRYAY